MTISNSLENKCPICNNDLKRWEGGLICAEFFQTTELFFNHKQDIFTTSDFLYLIKQWAFKNAKQNKLYHVYYRDPNNIKNHAIIFFILQDKDIKSYELYSGGIYYDSFNSTAMHKYYGNNECFFNCKTFDEVDMIINKLRIFS